jgi:hypothetical protein
MKDGGIGPHSLLDFYAGQALSGFLAFQGISTTMPERQYQKIADSCFEMARAMLEAKERCMQKAEAPK